MERQASTICADDWLDVEVAEWKACGLEMVVSLLEREEISELGLQRESELCRARGIEFVSFPIPDRGVPEPRQALEIANSLANDIANGRSIAIHCRAGIGRSSMIVVTALIQNGISAESAFHAVEEARGCPVPDTPEQRQWVESHSSRFTAP